MADQFRRVVLSLLPPDCYEEFFIKFNFFHGPCFKIALSKALGIGIIIGSLLVKIPQIAKILAAKSGQGISIWAILLELFALTSGTAYSYALEYPFSSWGETLFMVVQNVVIGALILYYCGQRSALVMFVSGYLIVFYILVSGMLPISFLWALQAANIPVMIVSKMIQILESYRNGGTGQLSAITVFLLFGGSTARVFTSIQETGDTMIIITYVIASLLNALSTAQMLYYWNATPTAAPSSVKSGGDAKHKKKE